MEKHVDPGQEPVGSAVEVAGRFMGPLKPLMVNFLWLRAIDAQDNTRYYEAYALSYSILQLEPRYTPIWVFTGWNLAYNISWDQTTPRDRFRWIMNGIELMEEGVARNPDSITVYWQLAHTYAHRLSPAGGDPYQAYFEEYLNPPADWLGDLGLEYSGTSISIRGGGELRLYETAVAAGSISLGVYPRPGSERRPAPYAVFYRPDGESVSGPDALAKLAPGVTLWEGAPHSAADVPPLLAGALVYRIRPRNALEGTVLNLPESGRLWVGFPPDRMTVYRRAAAMMEKGRARGPLVERGMDGLNMARELAHTYEDMGQFVEAEAIWLELLDGVQDRFRRGLEVGVVHFYRRVLLFYEKDREQSDVWRDKMESAMARMKSISAVPGVEPERGEQHEE
ncbi:MAG: hypothetical protein JW909_12895 [Planctomycetes bacterium]|nr:hypothetical protein [Planctomycetota bacterium]